MRSRGLRRRAIVDLGTLGGAWSQALAVNAAGQVVGLSGTAKGENHAFSWTRTGGMVDLGTIDAECSYPIGVSDAGWS